MWDEVLKLAMSNGLWAALFVALLIYELKDSRKRETKYQETIGKLNDSVGAITDVKKGVGELKTGVAEIKADVSALKDGLDATAPTQRKKAG